MPAREPPPVQRTLREAIGCVGIGWHTRARVALTLHPAEDGAGIRFRRADRPCCGGFGATVERAVACRHGLTLAGEGGARVASVERLLAALAVCGIDNLIVEVSGPEVPAMDGSARPFVTLIECVGTLERAAPRPVLEVLTPVEVTEGSAVARLEPVLDAAGPGVDLTVDLPDTPVGRRRLVLDEGAEAWRGEVAAARLAVREGDLAEMRAQGLARGATPANTVVLEPGGVPDPDGPVRYQAATALGALALLGMPLRARLVEVRGGHALRLRLLRRLLAEPDAFGVRRPDGAVVPGALWREAGRRAACG